MAAWASPASGGPWLALPNRDKVPGPVMDKLNEAIGWTGNSFRPRLIRFDGTVAGFKGLKYTYGLPSAQKPGFSNDKTMAVAAIKFMKASNTFNSKKASFVKAINALTGAGAASWKGRQWGNAARSWIKAIAGASSKYDEAVGKK